MGKSARKSSSPYARANRNLSRSGGRQNARNPVRVSQRQTTAASGALGAFVQTETEEPVSVRNRRDVRAATGNGRAGSAQNKVRQVQTRVQPGQEDEHDGRPVSTSGNGQPVVQQSQLSPEMEQVADTVTQRLVPEIKGQIRNAIEEFKGTPAVVVTPDTQGESMSGSHLTASNNTNLFDQYNVTAAQSFDDELGLGVSQQIRDKITNGEYVDLETLLVTSHTEQSRTIVIDNTGNLSLKQNTGKKITDISTWVNAMLIYTSIYIKAHPSSANDLLKYIYNVKLGAARCAGLGWFNYDQQFRLKRARNQSISWARVDTELWLLYITQGIAPQQAQVTQYQQGVVGKCYLYNNKGRCGRPACRYLHRCLKCEGNHSALYCIKSAQNTQNQNEYDGKGRSNDTFRSDFRSQRAFNRFNKKSTFQGTGSNAIEGPRKYTN